MGVWAEFTLAAVTNALPTDIATLYAAWVDANPSKVDRLSELVAETVRTFRDAVKANPLNGMDAAVNTIPSVAYHHALHWVIFNLGMEMGVQFAPQVYTLNTEANVWLRMVQNGGIPVDLMAEDGTPSYRRPVGRWLMADG